MSRTSDSSEIFLRRMITIRKLEERLLELFSSGQLAGTVHTCIGQEACAVGIASALDLDRDIVFSNHRGHGHYVAYSDDVEGLIAEVMGHPEGVCGGIGGSQHVQLRNFYTNGIQGAGAPIVVGMALAEKLKGTGSVAVVNLGDGTFGEGALYEAMNIASLWDVPMIFSVEHNRYAQTTPFELQHAGDLSGRGEAFGIETHRLDGMDVHAVAEVASAAVSRARSDMRPRLIFMETYRFAPHSKGDDFRDLSEIDRYRERDPINLLARQAGLEAHVGEIEAEVKERLDSIVHRLSEDRP